VAKKNFGRTPKPVTRGATPINKVSVRPSGDGGEYRGATPITVVNVSNVEPVVSPGTGPTPKPIVPVPPPPTKKK
jgi:hypothetical protein